MDEIMPTSAPMSTISRTQCSVTECVSVASRFNELTTGAPSPATLIHGTMPVSTSATPMYRMVHTISVAMMPIGTSLCGRLHSSLAVETESKPM